MKGELQTNFEMGAWILEKIQGQLKFWKLCSNKFENLSEMKIYKLYIYII